MIQPPLLPPPIPLPKKYESLERYEAAMRAIKLGVSLLMTQGSTETQPKSLRVGVNAAMIEHSALVSLLISKEIVTEDDYFESLATAAEREQLQYEHRISRKLKKEFHLR